MKVREQIEKILKKSCSYNTSEEEVYCCDGADKIISQVILDNWIVEEKCSCIDAEVDNMPNYGCTTDCGGTGIITRPALLSDLEREDVRLRKK